MPAMGSRSPQKGGCDRHGRLPLDKLLAEHGPGMPLPELGMILAADCPRGGTSSIYDRYHVYFPQLRTL
jgi:hypothetical protein